MRRKDRCIPGDAHLRFRRQLVRLRTTATSPGRPRELSAFYAVIADIVRILRVKGTVPFTRRRWVEASLNRLPLGLLAFLVLAGNAYAQATGQDLFEQRCASCHVTPAPGSRAPTLEQLRSSTPEAILATITAG